MISINPKDAVILDTRHSPFAQLKPISIKDVSLDGGFWNDRVSLNLSVTLQAQYNLLESTGRLDNFRRVSGAIKKPYQGFMFNDSDVYKWLEAGAWVMSYCHDDQLKHMVDRVITLIGNAQDNDGYLNSYFSLERVSERWTNLREKHELYCAGHLIQAAIAHYRVTGEDKLLNTAIRLADHIYANFGPNKRDGTSGHPEIELALVELYRTTGDNRYLELASLFINRRGHHLFGGGEYIQDHFPLREMEHLGGHAVRALYLCSGAADLVLENGEPDLLKALERLWTNTVHQQMYVTGGIGARHDLESIGRPYELPNARAYAESCAAIANVMWNWRMLQNHGEARYANLLEWTLYNAVLPGISLDGTEYFYINPLKDDGVNRRQEWFDCACCPPNISRTISMFQGYMYSISEDGIWLHLYAQSNANIELLNGIKVELRQTTSYPWDGQISLLISGISLNTYANNGTRSNDGFSLFLRIPDWVDDNEVDLKINDKPYSHRVVSGSYLKIHHEWQIGDIVSLNLPMHIRFIESHPFVEENYGRIAISRGPILYCLETVDNPNCELFDIQIDPMRQPVAEYLPHLLGGVMQLHLDGKINRIDQDWAGQLYRPAQFPKTQSKGREIDVIAIPYYAWANRLPGAMTIWNRIC